MPATRRALLALAAVGCLSALLSTGVSAEGLAMRADKDGLAGITKPSGDVTLSFVHPGRIIDIPVKEGDPVKAGQLVAQQDASEEEAALAIAKAESEDITALVAEQVYRDQKAKDLEKMKAGGKGVGALELDAAALEVTIGEARVKIQEFKKAQAVLKYQQTLVAVEKLKLFTPIDGVVALRMLKVGEIPDGQNSKVMRIVQLDPLWVEVSVPTLQARRLKISDEAQVTFSDKQVHVGKVALVFPVGDSASETINVRIEVPNPQKLQPGENVRVNFGKTSVVSSHP